MDEQNQQHSVPVTPTPEASSAGGINFDQLLITNQSEHISPVLNNDSLESSVSSDVAQAPDQTSDLLTQANADMKENPEWPAIDISTISIEEISHGKNTASAQSLGESGVGADLLTKFSRFNYRKIVSISTFVAVFSFLGAGVLFLAIQYLTIASQPTVDPVYQPYVWYVKDYQKLRSEYTNLDDYYRLYSTSLVGAAGIGNITSLLNSPRLSYVQKKDIFQNGITALAGDMARQYTALDSLKSEITKNGFFPMDLMSIFGDEKDDVFIKKSLLSLEVIKFSTAIKVFSYLDTFIQGLANLLNMSSDDVKSKMQALDERGDKDIITYLYSCYLNPFEVDENCSFVGDFDAYYSFFDKKSAFDTAFFKKLMYYIDLKLEQSDFPSFAIVFHQFDPKQKEISFNVEVNTFKQDEVSLLKQWIVNPHIFVVTQLLDLLKQSLFVIGENIDTKQLKIEPKIVQIWSTTFPVNTSSLSFVLPLQKNSQREISDFVLPKDAYLSQNTQTTGSLPSSINTWTTDTASWAVVPSVIWILP